MNRKEMLDVIEASWKYFERSIEGLSEAELEQPGVIGEWSIKDTLGHLTACEQLAIEDAELARSGVNPASADRLNVDEYNAEEARKRHAWPQGRIRNEADDTRQRLRQLIESLTDEEWNTKVGEGDDAGTIGQWIGGDLGGDLGPGTHAAEHAHEILLWRVNRQQQPTS